MLPITELTAGSSFSLAFFLSDRLCNRFTHVSQTSCNVCLVNMPSPFVEDQASVEDSTMLLQLLRSEFVALRSIRALGLMCRMHRTRVTLGVSAP